jgi:TolB-like protein/Flp pilus assembly protein TadD
VTPPATPEKSIAVLPFENLSGDPNNAYFAEGMQEEILTRLAKIAELKVISRASTERYQNKPRDLAEIAKQLGVANILEGSVQKAADQVRVNVQLINARTDSHLWAETYDRKLTDIFAIESEIARRIAESLQTKLTGSERQALAAKPTNNPAAYDAYLRGRAFADASNWIASNVESSIQSYQHAVALDPGFALAWARLSFEQMWSYWQGFDASPARLRAAKEATDRAVALDPDLSEVRRALGYYRYWAERDFSGALAEFRAARDGAPNDAEMIEAVAVIQRRLGHFDEAIAEIHRAIELNPRHVLAYQFLAETLGHVRRFPEALAAVESASILQPADATSLRLKANLLWRSTGDVQAVAPLLVNSTSEPEIRARQFLFQRDYAAAIGVLSKSLPATTADQRMGGYLPERQELQLLLGLSQQRAGDTSAARATYQQAVQDIRRALASVASGSNMEATLHSALGEAYAGLDEADAAIDEGRKATTIMPASKDLAEFTVYEEKMARIFAQLGDADRATDLLKRLLQTPYDFAITPGLLRLDPIWDPLRSNPRFQKLCEKKQP